MQQNAAQIPQQARVQFPEQLAASEVPRPPSARPLPRVGSNSKVPTLTRPSNHPVEAFERVRTPSTGSSGRPDGLGIGYPSRSPGHGPSPLNPQRRRGSGQHTHRRRDSSEHFDASKYDLDDALDHAGNEDDNQLPVEHQEALAKLMQRRKRRADAQRAVNHSEVVHHAAVTSSPADILFSRQRAQTSKSLPLETNTLLSSSTLAESSMKSPNSLIVTSVRSDSPSSQELSGRSLEQPLRTESSNSDRPDIQDPNWTNVFRKNATENGKGRKPISKEQYEALESDMEERISRVKTNASSGSWERARTAADQLRRRYAIIFPSIAPGEKPFNIMDVIRWRRRQFDESLASPPEPSRESEIERQTLSWRPHLSDLHDPHNTRYKPRIYAPWHLTALFMEQYLESLKPQPRSYSPSRSLLAPSNSTQGLQLTPEHSQSLDTPIEYDSNQSGIDAISRRFNSLRRLRKSLPGGSKSMDLSPRQSPHQSKASISSLHLFNHSRPVSPSGSRANLRKRIDSISPSKVLGEHSDEGELSAQGSLSAQERGGNLSSGGQMRVPDYTQRSSSAERDRLVLPSSEDDKSRLSSEEAVIERRHKSRFPRPFFGRDETVIPVLTKSTPGHVPSLSNISELDLMKPTPDPEKRFRLRAPETGRARSLEAREERRRSREEKELDFAYDNREATCQDLEELIKEMNQGQYQLLQVGRDYVKQATRLKEIFGLEEFNIPTEEEIRILAEPTSRSHARWGEATRDPTFVQKLRLSEQEAKRLHDEIRNSHFSPPVMPQLYSGEDNLDADKRKLEIIGWDLDYVRRVATDHLEKGSTFNAALASLRSELGQAFAHTSQVYREILALETLVAASRPVPTWKRISNRVKPTLSWGVTALTLILKFLGEIGRIVGFMLPSFLKNLFGWEMLSGAWPRFVFVVHFILLLIIRRIFGWYWSFEEGIMGAIWIIPLGYLFYAAYWIAGLYTREIRYHVLVDWWETSQKSTVAITWREWLSRRWYALLLIVGGILPWCLIYLFAL